jgi:hypothetical protein
MSKKSQKFTLIQFFIISFTFFSCVFDKSDNKLKLVNNTQNQFYYIVKKDSTLQKNDVNYINTNEKSIFHFANINDTCFPLFAFKNQGGFIRKINQECLDSTLFIYIFEVDSVKKYNWDLIISKKLFSLKGFKIKNLDSLNWIIKMGDFGNY